MQHIYNNIICLYLITVQLQSYNLPTYYIGRSGQDAYIKEQITPHKWKMVAGLCGMTGAVSFKSLEQENYYLQHRGSLLYSNLFVNSSQYKRESCFIRYASMAFPGYDAFESVDSRSHFIVHANYRLKLESQQNSADFEKRASFSCFGTKVRNYTII